jgi:hypothetical protein
MHEMEAETLQRAMVSEFGGDPSATDSTRVLRVPNFVNRKYETQHLVEARAEATQTYHLEDFRLRTDAHDGPYTAKLQTKEDDAILLATPDVERNAGPHLNNDDHAIRSSGSRTEAVGRCEVGDIPRQRSNGGR